jgi:DsbC/DsbD-like thiol-disulfide interchange protein
VRLLIASLLVLAAQTAALKPGKLPREVEGRQLEVTVSQSATTARPGGTIALLVDVRPKRGMHVYAPEQTGGYIRIELDLDEDPAFKARKPSYPKASDYYFDPLKETFKVYDAPFRIRQDVTVTRIRTPLTITGTLRYQACDDLLCYRPDQVKLSWTVTPERPKH